ncbi:sigma-54-dependent Fis family transcriptional regulator [Aeromonas caviae]|uniref:Sigma-54-dependent Fis family transcriptional regulator n=2 Tax=Aeromonas caviae TaxID=648 RepID=A0AAV4YQ53_AERCA|nr:sigma-54-dependent Fis family transcriptional regulator [Aeromonas caviae]GJA34267.1 sigma-54-dependent Fis family transcriptional regulator [Aeromonas caviae]GJA38691.1 sigma-54-dependent Fis family transcriptional regulator [Aeromonas caviae]GJA43253.1 sigma-54-dependent Fis family transcriptional regulator [Aeromonas caviae]GJA78966.1 sigma-54-dependent Fis family transcriptional regulator [Aeromonas caviae]
MTPSLLPDIAVTMPSVPQPLSSWPEHLQASWLRCAHQTSASLWHPPHCARGQTLESLRQRKRDLLTTGEMALEDLYEFMEGRPCALLLTDESGCLLARTGHPDTLQALAALGFGPGAFFSEGRIGTNAVNLAALEGVPLCVSGPQHFNQSLHPWHCCASPVYNSTGRQVAIVALICRVEEAAPGDLALTVSAGRELANLLQMERLMQESQHHLSELYALLDGMEDGVLAWDPQGRLRYLNALAASRLQLDPAFCLGQPLDHHLLLPQRLRLAIAEMAPLSHVEVTLERRETRGEAFIDAMVSLKPLPGPDGVSFIVLLHPTDRLRAIHQLRQTVPELSALVGESSAMRKLLRHARQAARGQGPVLLRGEEEVGKAQLAEAIHFGSERAAGPLVIFNCQAWPRERMALELMGSDEAGQERAGKFELAHGGTLVLEQVECLPLRVRIIATSSAPLEQRVQEGEFGRQLLYALQGCELWLPSLRERRADLPGLIRQHLTVQGGEPGRQFTSDALDCLLAYPWPGNLGELRSAIEYAQLHCSEAQIPPRALPAAIRQGHCLLVDEVVGQPRLTLAELEHQAILRAARASNGQVSQMARQLGISRTTLCRRLKLLDIDPADYHH